MRYLAAWEPPADIERSFPQLEVLFSVGAGVDQFDFSTLPPELPVVRMVEPGIVGGMVEYVCFAVLGLHRDMPRYLQQQRQAQWQALPVCPAGQRRVGVLAWARWARRGMLDVRLFAGLPRGASLVNVGRGGHLVVDDLLRALDEGQLGAAVLDVCDPEPLPARHPFWQHPRIWLTPHVASMTRPETAVDVVLDNLRRHRAGEPLVGLVDRARGY